MSLPFLNAKYFICILHSGITSSPSCPDRPSDVLYMHGGRTRPQRCLWNTRNSIGEHPTVSSRDASKNNTIKKERLGEVKLTGIICFLPHSLDCIQWGMIIPLSNFKSPQIYKNIEFVFTTPRFAKTQHGMQRCTCT